MLKSLLTYLLVLSYCTLRTFQSTSFWPGEWLSIAAHYERCCMPAQNEKLLIIENENELIAVTTHSKDSICEAMGLDSEIYEMRFPWDKDQKDFKPEFINQMNEKVNSRFTYIGATEFKPDGAAICMEIETDQSAFGGKIRCPFIICKEKEGQEIFVNRSAHFLEGSFHDGMSYGEKIFEEYFRDDAKNNYRSIYQMFEARKFSLQKCEKEPLIPHKIHTIWMGVNMMPSPSMFRIAEWKKLHPHWQVKIWNDTEVRDLVKPYQSFFNKLRTDAMRVDFARLLILRDEGGLFVELDVLPKKSYDDLVCRYEYFTGVSYGIGHYKKHMIEINVLGAAKNSTLINSNIQYVLDTVDIKLKKFDSTFYSIYLRDNNVKDLNWIEPTRGPYHLLAMTVMMFSYSYNFWMHQEKVNRSILLPKFYHNPITFTHDMPYALSEHYVWKVKPLKPPLLWDEAIKNYTLVSPFENNKYDAFRGKYTHTPLTKYPFLSEPKIPQILHLFTGNNIKLEQDWINDYCHWEIITYQEDDSTAYCKKLQVLFEKGGVVVYGDLIRPTFRMDDIVYKLDFFGTLDHEDESVVISENIFGAIKEHKIIKKALLKDCKEGLLIAEKSLTNITYEKFYLSKDDLILPSHYFFCDNKCDETIRNISYAELR